MKSALLCMICRILYDLVRTHLFCLISRLSPRPHPHKSTCFSPTSHFFLDSKSCLCSSLYLAVVLYAHLETAYLPFQTQLDLGTFPSTPVPTLKHLSLCGITMFSLYFCLPRPLQIPEMLSRSLVGSLPQGGYPRMLLKSLLWNRRGLGPWGSLI